MEQTRAVQGIGTARRLVELTADLAQLAAEIWGNDAPRLALLLRGMSGTLGLHVYEGMPEPEMSRVQAAAFLAALGEVAAEVQEMRKTVEGVLQQ